MPSFETVIYKTRDDYTATITLNRPEAGNAYNQKMVEEFEYLWEIIREDMDVHAVVLRAAGDSDFSVGEDTENPLKPGSNVWSELAPFRAIGPRHNRVWKPVICAVAGLVNGGGFHFVNQSDIVICTPDAEFCIDNVSRGRVATAEPIGLAQRIPFGEAMRMVLMGEDERILAETALKISLVTEIVPEEMLWARADELAASIAAKDYRVVQGSVMAMWESLEYGYKKALARTQTFQDRAFTTDLYYDTNRGESALRKRFETSAKQDQ